MEQLKPFIEGLKANRFWIFCGATLLACIAVYYMVNNNLTSEEKAAAGKITTTVNTAKSLLTSGVPVDPEAEDGKGNSQVAHPNDDTIKEMELVVKAAAAATKEAWEKKHQLQAAFQVFDKETIRETAVDFQKYLPAEAVPLTDADDETMLPETVRVNYRDRIRDELPKLAALVRSYWKPNYNKDDPKPREVIEWNEDNQEYWHARFTNFVSAFNYQAAESNVPRTLQVLYTTEDLWLLRSILRDVIGKTVFDKGEIYANDLAVIKKIDHILIGRDAELGDQGLPGQGGGMNQSPGRGQMSSMPTSSSKVKGKSQASNDPINGRYVDSEGKDIPAKDYRSIYASKGTGDKKKTYWKIAKRVKVRIGLQMDTREIQNLQANCANANFPIEIRSLRVNKHKPSKLKSPGTGSASKTRIGGSSQGGGGGMGGDIEQRTSELGMAGGSAAPGSSGGSTPGSGGASGGAKSGDVEIDDQGYVKPVEIYGYIYIYNRVDESMFKILDDKKTNP